VRKYTLIIGSLIAVLIVTFLMGLQLGQAQMYDTLTFGNGNSEVYVKVSTQTGDILIKRYRDDDRIGIMDSLEVNQTFQQVQQQLSEALEGIPGLDNYKIADHEITLFKLENFHWKDIIKQVLDAIRAHTV